MLPCETQTRTSLISMSSVTPLTDFGRTWLKSVIDKPMMMVFHLFSLLLVCWVLQKHSGSYCSGVSGGTCLSS